VEIAKFVLTAVGTFLSVFSLSFAVFQYWRKKQDEKFDLLKKSVDDKIRAEAESRKESDARHEDRLRDLETTMAQRFEGRLSSMEGELKGIKSILQSIQNWFINNTGGKGIEQAAGRELSNEMIQRLLRANAHSLSITEVNDQIAWLENRGYVRVVRLEGSGFINAHITRAGIDVAKGYAKADGIDPPPEE
jgi:phage host-nuclease inhibitor protein Gam